MLEVIENPTSIEVYWKPISDANGYVVFVDDIVYDIIENITITIDELTPGTIYLITVRAYQDILGPSSTTYATTNNGKNFESSVTWNYYIILFSYSYHNSHCNPHFSHFTKDINSRVNI